MQFVLDHTRLCFCWWDLAALIILLAVIAVYLVQHRKMKQQEKELQDQLSALYADAAVDPEQKL